MAGVTERRDTIDRRAVLRLAGRSARRAFRRRRILRLTLVQAAAIAALRADLQELAANLHGVAASIHDLRREEHVHAFLDGVGDPFLHKQGAERHRAAAAIERASAEKERRAAKQDATRPAPTV